MLPPLLANPRNPWDSHEVEYLEEIPRARFAVHEDQTREILSTNTSPDLPFRFSINPYRGCMHACAYCYARPTHEYLSLGAGTDFDTRISVKLEAADLLRRSFERPSWKGERIVFSGVTDPYQPLEASYRLTRACLEVCAEYRNPISIITKGALIERDVDVLSQLARDAEATVTLSLPFFDPEHARALEPLAPSPARRLRVIEKLSGQGIPVGINVAPVIPGLNDEQLVKVLTSAREAGAQWAHYVLLRLPGSVKEVFEERLRTALPLRAERVLHRLKETQGGALYDNRFFKRGRGEGRYAESIANLFTTTSRRLGFDTELFGEAPASFRRPAKVKPQLELF